RKFRDHLQLLGSARAGECAALGLDANRCELRAWLCRSRRQRQSREDHDRAKSHGLLPVAWVVGAAFSGFATTIRGTSSVSTTCATLPSLMGRTTTRAICGRDDTGASGAAVNSSTDFCFLGK